MSKATRATRALEQAGIAFSLHRYDYDPDADRIGLQAAEALAAPPAEVLKTLMAKLDGKPVCVILPSDETVSMKKLAAAFGGKSAQMMPPPEAERLSGYKVGGISPFGQMRRLPVAIEATALAHPQVYINGGQRGLQIRLAPADAASFLAATVAPLTA
ncbi:Cys-tRNA(Pro) deacylase [Thioclava sp. BHET1]|nr:Cys-tRNA(Pro) deacylase [Thioclava sp. BHET1]